MNKITSLTSQNLVAQNIETLKQLFPTIVKEGQIDFAELQSLLGEEIVDKDEYYRFTWAGKSQARLEANKPSTATLRPDKESSKNWDTTKNIFIEGDNLEVLKLLQKSYANRIKMIYIDPPYNTGKDFVYKDNYADNLQNYLDITGQTDDQGKKTSTNTESDGRYHSNWLNMMYPRLRLARNLLTDDGVIFISIDDNEMHNLRKLCDEILGEENSLTKAPTALIWPQSGTTAGHFAKAHEYILCYAKNKECLPFFALEDYGDDDVIAHGALKKISKANPASEITFRKGSITFAGSDAIFEGEIGGSEKQIINGQLIFKQGLLSEDVTITAGWAMKDQVLSWLAGDETFDSKGQKIIRFYFNSSGILWYEKERGTIHPKTILDKEVVGTKTGANEVRALVGDYFENPKPLSLLHYLLSFSLRKNDNIIDFFAGSGTTAHAVMQLNAEDGGNRQCISVQLPEPTEESSEAHKAGYKNIAEITKERIRRAGEKIVAEHKGLLEKAEKELSAENAKLVKDQNKIEELQDKIQSLKSKIQNLDIGFKAFKLDSSNIRAWDGNPQNLEQQLELYAQNIKEDRTENDILFEVLLKYGLDLTVPIEEKTIAGNTVYNVGAGTMFVCLSDSITPAVSEEIGKWKEELRPAVSSVIFKDSGFGTDKDKTNAIQILKRFGVEEVNSI